MSNISKSFLDSINQTMDAYERYGARSNKKLLPIHSWFSKTIKDRLGDGYEVLSLGAGKEFCFEGRYYPKNLDITVAKNGKAISSISFKFVTSNYKQNANNYFENLMGETANLRRNNLGYAHFIVFRGHTPYYDKNSGNKRGALKKTEIINEKDLSKYVKLSKDLDFPHKPQVIGISLVDGVKDISDCTMKYSDLNKYDFAEETKSLLLNEFSIDTFIDKFIHLTKLHE